jgi:DNA-binding LacI/PurR family transcriptional regulator
MARRFNSEIPVVQYRGVTIRLYRRRDGWKSTFQLHGHKRRECYRSTEAAAQQAAQNAIGDELEPNAVAANKDEVTARALLAPHGVSLIESARYWASNTHCHRLSIIEMAL